MNFFRPSYHKPQISLATEARVSAPARGEWIDSLTGLRFFAAAAIVLHHLSGFHGFSLGLTGPYSLGQGVSVFFVLSGFILAHVYPSLLSGRDALRFIWARVARIWPVHVTVLSMVLYLHGMNSQPEMNPSESIWPLVANITLTHAFIPYPAYFFSFNSVSWSISTEFGFYLMFPILIANFQMTWPWKMIAALALSICIVQAAVHFQLPTYAPDALGITHEGWTYVNPVARVCEFIAGMIAAYLFRLSAPNHQRKSTAQLIVWTGLEICAVGLLIFNLAIGMAYLWPVIYTYGSAGLNWVTMTLTPMLPAAILIFILAHNKGLISKALSTPVLRFLGEISFSIYMSHLVLLSEFGKHDAPFGSFAIPAYLGCAFITAIILYYCVEIPMRRFLVHLPDLIARWATALRPRSFAH